MFDVQGTGSWSTPGKTTFMSYVTYRDAQGRLFALPVHVAGDQMKGSDPAIGKA